MTNSNVKLAYIGSIVPDEFPYINMAFSRAGNMCQYALLTGLVKAGLTPSVIFSLRPAVSFPGSRKVLFGGASTIIENSIHLIFLPFINITPIKQITVGLATLYSLLLWGWRTRHASKRIVYTFNISVPPGLFTILAAKLTNSKAIAMIYDINEPGESVPATLINRLDFWLHKITLPLFDGLVVITDAIAVDFAPKVPTLRVEGGIKSDLIEQYRSLEGSQKHNPNYFTIVAAGRLDDANGIREIVAAFSLLDGEKYQLHIAGTGPLEAFVKASASHDPRIQFHGFISFDEVLKLYTTADLLLNIRLTQRLNTRYFFPSKAMEYLASGVPVITTCPGNMAEEYGDLAYLLHTETSEALAELIRKVEAVPVEQRLARARTACEYIANNKTWDAQAKRISLFIHQISGVVE